MCTILNWYKQLFNKQNEIKLAHNIQQISYEEILSNIEQYNLLILERKYQRFLNLKDFLKSTSNIFIDKNADKVFFDKVYNNPMDPFFSHSYDSFVLTYSDLNNLNNLKLLNHAFNLIFSFKVTLVSSALSKVIFTLPSSSSTTDCSLP